MLEKWKVPFCFTILKGILWDGEFFFSQQERSGEMHGELGALWGLTSDGMA